MRPPSNSAVTLFTAITTTTPPLQLFDSTGTNSSPTPPLRVFALKEIMVYYYKSTCGKYTIYMGRDKFENEDLIKYGWPEDVWFHVDDLSSAHVYLRMDPGMTLDDVSQDLLLECASLVKANSIVGCKVSASVDAVVWGENNWLRWRGASSCVCA
jgi:NFACT protein RNA binding domain